MKFIDCITPNQKQSINQSTKKTINNSQTSNNTNNQPTSSNYYTLDHNNAINKNNLQTNNKQYNHGPINTLITNIRESKDNKTQPKSNASPALTINQRQIDTYTNNKMETNMNNKNEFSLKGTIMFKNPKQPSNTLIHDAITENDDTLNSSSSSIDGNLQICEDTNSSLSSNGDNTLENVVSHFSPINTRSKTNSIISENCNIPK